MTREFSAFSLPTLVTFVCDANFGNANTRRCIEDGCLFVRSHKLLRRKKDIMNDQVGYYLVVHGKSTIRIPDAL